MIDCPGRQARKLWKRTWIADRILIIRISDDTVLIYNCHDLPKDFPTPHMSCNAVSSCNGASFDGRGPSDSCILLRHEQFAPNISER